VNDPVVCAALADFYYAGGSAGGSGWQHSSGWSEAASGQAIDYCQMQGLSCTGGVLTSL